MTDTQRLLSIGWSEEGAAFLISKQDDPLIKGFLEDVRGERRAFKGVWICAELWMNEELTWTEKCLLAEIDSLDDGNGCRATAGYLAKMMGSTPPSIRAMLCKLASKGFLSSDVSSPLRRLRVLIQVNTPLLTAVNTPVNGCLHPPLTAVNTEVLSESTNKISTENDGGGVNGFDVFWDAYPRKVGRRAAAKIWHREKLEKFLQDILTAISKQKRSEQWRKDGGRFIPHPSTWLNQGRWEDETRSERSGEPELIDHLIAKDVARARRLLGET